MTLVCIRVTRNYSSSVPSKRALITGARGQDGQYLAELLRRKGYAVAGVEKAERLMPESPSSAPEGIELTCIDLTDAAAVRDLIGDLRPTYIFHLASMSFVPASWDDPVSTSAFTVASAVQLLDAIRAVDPEIRYVGAASAEIFGHPEVSPQDEQTPVRPTTPYGAAKAHAHFLTKMYRSRYGLHCSSAILYNHESPKRPPEFLPRKVSSAVAAIKLGLQTELKLGNLEAKRDWAFAGDVVRAMYLMAAADRASDYVVATGRAHSVRDLVEAAFAHVSLDYTSYVITDPELLRGSADAAALVGDSTRARTGLGWEPEVDFAGLVAMMVDADLALLHAAPEDLAG